MTAPLHLHQAPRRPLACRLGARRRRRGFTLIEMLIAMMAGLLIAGAAFLLARNATTFFQAETSITTAQFASMVGMTRMQAELRRAGLQTLDNVQIPPSAGGKLCGSTGSWPAGMQELASVQIRQNGSVLDNGDPDGLFALADNQRTPDSLVLGGMAGTTEHFAIQALYNGSGGGWDILLQDDGAMWRTRLAAANPATMLNDIFVVGRFLRIVDSEGRSSYGVISGITMSGNLWRVSVGAIPAVPTKSTTSGLCGCTPPCVGNLVNPVVRYRYDIRPVDSGTYPQYAGLFAAATHNMQARHKGEVPVARTELVRVELDANDVEINASLEVLAEYAVDLKFGITEAIPGGPAATTPTLVRHPIGSAPVYAIAAPLSSNGTPERIRAVQIQLSIRSAKRDRDVGIVGPGGGLLRFSLGQNRGFARMRTLTADVALPNADG